ncbi:ABC transporter permease [Parapedobacter sp. DT-150]|uniref:ABC transporter permease n=1 Tax=Parapedobacter sp. DT-150 TaxID=3396162 RepID=UPI003F1B85D9
MWKNYFKIGIRNILKYKVFSLINIFGLALGMSVCMLIILMLADQKNMDRFHVHKDRIYRIISDEDDSKAPNAATAFPLANALKTDYPVVETTTHLIKGIGGEARFDGNMAEMKGYFADASFFKVFGFTLAHGDKDKALTLPNSMVIGQEMAEKLFGDDDPIGKTVEFFDRGGALDDEPVNWGLYTITGVMAEHPKSHLEFDVLVAASSAALLIQENKMADFTAAWNDYQSYTYVLLAPGKHAADLAGALNDLASHQYAGEDTPKGYRLMAQPLLDINPGIIVRNPPSESLPMLVYYFLAVLGLLILFSACLNYINLSIARALTRAKEIGVRKVNGAHRKDLIFQFIGESVLTALLALVFSFVFLFFIKQGFEGLWINQDLKLDLQPTVAVYLIFVVFALLIGFVSGAYPALYISKFSPTKALNNLYKDTPGKLGFQKVLSTSQFVISLFFIITSILIYNQGKHYLEFEYGFNSNGIINIALQGNDHQRVVHELNAMPEVALVSASDIIPATNVENGISLRAAGREEEPTQFNILNTDEHFIANIGVNLVAGKGLPPEGVSSDRYILVNEATVHALGYQHPDELIGQVLQTTDSAASLEVIGVVADFRYKMLMNQHAIGPLVLRNKPDEFNYVNVRLAAGNSIEQITKLEEKWESIDPVHPLEYHFFDDQLNAMYRSIFDIVTILGYIAFLAVTIACLGMFAMATYTTERRTKEVGIRKVLGAGNLSIVLLLSRGFIRILLIAVLIGTPISYLVNNLWLHNFANRVDFGFGTMMLGVAVLVTLGLITIGAQTIAVSLKSPVDTLRSE